MEANILKIVGQVAGIGGLSLGVLLLVFREVIRKNIFPTLTKVQSFRIIKLIIWLTFAVALIGMGLWVFVARSSEPTVASSDVKLGLSTADIHGTVVNSFLMLRNDGDATATGIEVELNVLSSDTFGIVRGENLLEVKMEPPTDDAGRDKPFRKAMVYARRLIPGDYITMYFQSKRSEWDALVPQMRQIVKDFQFPHLVNATYDQGWITIDHSIITLHGFGESEGDDAQQGAALDGDSAALHPRQ